MTRKLRRFFVTNHGEIAERVICAERELGMTTIAKCSAADRSRSAAKLAGEVVEIGAGPAAKSYLNAPAIVSAALEARADAVHPGYRVLSENIAFAHSIEDARIAYVGPASDTIELMGDKARARLAAHDAGVSAVAGSVGLDSSEQEAQDTAASIGFPVMIKAAAGGRSRYSCRVSPPRTARSSEHGQTGSSGSLR